MKALLSISLIFILLLSSIGIHIDYAFCGQELKHLEVMHSSSVEDDCCNHKKEKDCCTTQEIVQEATLINGLVNSSLKIQPIVVFVAQHFGFVTTERSTKSTRFTYYEPPPPEKERQSLYQVFLC